MKPILDGLKSLGPARLAALVIVGLAMLGMLGMLAMRGGAPARMSLLYTDLDPREAGQIADALDRAHITHEETGAGDRILVPASDVARARLLLAKDGLPSGGSVGYEIFDHADAMTSSQFQQEINETRALEGEIARSLRMIGFVRAARVHLVLPRRQAFARDAQPAQASVMLTMSGAARLDPQAVQAILNLVSAAVPGLKPQAIAIIDSHGTLLARAGQPTTEESAIQTGEELRRATETRLSRAIEDMLEQSLGPGKVRAEAAVEMNFERVNQTEEKYDPDQQVVRSTQSVSDTNHSTEGEKPVSVQNNLPNADAGAPAQSGSQSQRQEETTNYEIGKTVRSLVREQPQIARISLAVMIDGDTTPDAAGKPAWHERSPEDMARITRLVQSAIGYDAKRGDKVEVVSMRFVQPEDTAAEPSSSGLLSLGLEKSDIMGLAQSAMLAAAVLLALMFVLRPMALRLAGAGELAVAGPAHMLAGPAEPAAAARPAAETPAMLPDETMINVANIEGQIRASSIRRLAGLVDKHPDESLSIMRGWMSQDRG